MSPFNNCIFKDIKFSKNKLVTQVQHTCTPLYRFTRLNRRPRQTQLTTRREHNRAHIRKYLSTTMSSIIPQQKDHERLLKSNSLYLMSLELD